MSAFQDQITEHSATVFLNESHFAQSMICYSKTGDSRQFSGVLDSQKFSHENNDDADRDQFVAYLTVSVETEANIDREGWIAIGSQRYFVEGESERDRDFVTLIVKTNDLKTLRKVRPHK